jgi:acyl-CoA reductase-like NAD-dependent aldehyde dehydrogenase
MPMGNGLDDTTVVGPLQNEMQRNKVAELVDDARARGARILTGGAVPEGPGNFYPITLVADIEAGARLVDEEQFGTALPIIRYSDVEEAIVQANGLDVGLGASVWASDPEAARKVADRIEAGTVYINQHGQIAPHVPFGGIKGSGIGVEFGQEGLEANTDIKIYNMAKTG